MRKLGLVVKAIAYIIGLNSIFYYGIIPAIGGMWSWGEWGLPMVIGLVFSAIFMGLGDWLRNKGKIANAEKSPH